MWRDYHMHPQVILGAERFDAYAEKALEQGVEEVCISDHMPLSVSAAKDRIPAGRVGEYCEICEEIRQKYEGRLRVKCGIEIDYHPAFMNEIEAVLSAGKFDWIHGSTHLHASCPDMFSEPMDYGTFARKALDMGVKFSYGSDSHASKDVGVMLPELRTHPLYGPALSTWEEA